MPRVSASCLPTTIPSSVSISTTAESLILVRPNHRRRTSSSGSTPTPRSHRPVLASTSCSRGNFQRVGTGEGALSWYDSARYFTVTGKHLEGTPLRVARRQDALEAIHREYVQKTENHTETGTDHSHVDVGRSESDGPVDVDLDDEDLLEKARNASNGEKFQRLWNGQTRGYESHSEADLALCSLLAFWTGGDRSRIDRLFRQSGLMREKWDEVHYADGSTYGEKTIERAVAGVSEYYDPEAADGLDSMTEPTGTGSAGQRHAHLAEKNRLLTERVAELEIKLEAKEERIAELEAELQCINDRNTSNTSCRD